MKNITLLILFFCGSLVHSQVWTTGEVTVTTGYSVQFDIDTGTNIVTLTMIGPDNQWLGVAPGVSAGMSMGSSGDDVVVYNQFGLQDRNMTGGTNEPNVDSSQDWTIVSNDTSGGTRTLVATRARDTGDANDFVFPTSGGALPMLWAKGSDINFGYHGNTKGGTVANLALSADDFEIIDFKISPNPVTTKFEVIRPQSITNVSVEVYNVIGKLVHVDEITQFNSDINTSDWESGIYLVKLTSEKKTQTKRIIKR